MVSAELRAAFRLVRSQLAPPPPVERPVLVVLSGLPGTGKTTLAYRLAETWPALVIQSDFVRKTLFPQPTHSEAESRFIHAVARALIRDFLKSGHCVIADSTNLVEQHRQILLRLAKAVGVPAVVVRTTAPAEVVQNRLRERFARRSAFDVSDADWHVYELLSGTVQPIGVPHLQVDTTRDLDETVQRIIHAARNSTPKPNAHQY